MKKDVHLRIKTDLYLQIVELANFNNVTINEEVNNLLELALQINENEKSIKEILDNIGTLKKDSSYIKHLLIQTYTDLNLEPLDSTTSESLEKFNKKYHKRNMND